MCIKIYAGRALARPLHHELPIYCTVVVYAGPGMGEALNPPRPPPDSAPAEYSVKPQRSQIDSNGDVPEVVLTGVKPCSCFGQICTTTSAGQLDQRDDDSAAKCTDAPPAPWPLYVPSTSLTEVPHLRTTGASAEVVLYLMVSHLDQ